MKFKDYYEILGVARTATEDEIRKAYRRLARKFHPDVSKEADAEERFKEVGAAYETLKDPEKRRAYDGLGRHAPGEEFELTPEWEEHFRQAFSGFDARRGFDVDDLFGHFSGARGFRAATGGGGRGPRGPGFAMAGEDYEATVRVTLEQACHGTEVGFEMADPSRGGQAGADHVPIRSIRVRIPAGTTDGTRMRVPGKGGPGIGGGPSGDLYLNIVLEPHARFRVSGRDLQVDLPLAPWEAVLGSDVTVPTLDGEVRVKVRAGAVAGQHLRVTGKGLPLPGGSGRGDLYCVVRIVVPAQVGERERKLYEDLRAASRFDARAQAEKGTQAG